MAGYPKIWTTIRHEVWFKRLRSVQRSIWLQLILIAKEQFDDGHLTFNSYSHMGAELGCDRGSVAMWVGREVGEGRASVVEKSATVLHLYLTNYNDSQGVIKYKPNKTGGVSRAEHKAEQEAEKKEGSREPADLKKPTISKRTPAQKWMDGQLDLISKKYQEIWSSEPDIKDMVVWLKWADKSVGLVIVGLQQIIVYEKRENKKVENTTGWLHRFFRNRSDNDIVNAKKIDRDYEMQYKSRTNIKTVGEIFSGIK